MALQRCNLQASQRWLRRHPNVGANGLDYWQLRNLGDGRCLASGRAVRAGQSVALLQPCEASPDWRQQVAFLTAS